MTNSYEVDDLVIGGGRKPFRECLDEDFDYSIQARILDQIARFEEGNFGHCRHLDEGVFETKCTFGGGVRIYFGVQGTALVLLILCGNKGTQEKDIARAKALWKAHKEAGDHG